MTVPAHGSTDPRAEPLIRSLAILVDFANCDELRDSDEPGIWQYFFTGVIRSAIEQIVRLPERLVVRLYGGWQQRHSLTQHGSIVSAILAEVDPFPIVVDNSVIPGELQLALSPVGMPSAILPDTFRRREAAPRIQRNSGLEDPTCSMNGDCGARVVARWTKSPGKLCFRDGCVVASRDAFVTAEQKMVDTLLAIDIVELATRQSFSSVVVVSDDTDFIPPLIYSASLSNANLIVMAGSAWTDPHAELLERSGIQLVGRAV